MDKVGENELLYSKTLIAPIGEPITLGMPSDKGILSEWTFLLDIKKTPDGKGKVTWATEGKKATKITFILTDKSPFSQGLSLSQFAHESGTGINFYFAISCSPLGTETIIIVFNVYKGA